MSKKMSTFVANIARERGDVLAGGYSGFAAVYSKRLYTLHPPKAYNLRNVHTI